MAEATAIATRQKQQLLSIRKTLEIAYPEFRKSLPSHINPEYLCRIAQTQVYRNPLLIECTAVSWVVALLNSASVGVVPDGRKAYLIPYRNNKRGGVYEVQYQLGYQGMCDLAYRSGMVSSIVARVAYEGDHFEVQYGLEDKLVHVPALSGSRGQMVASYCVARIRDGGPVFIVLTAEDVARRRAASRSAESSDSPWKNWPEAMWAKSAVRAISPWLPQTPEYARGLDVDDYADTGVPSSDILEVIGKVENVTGEQTGDVPDTTDTAEQIEDKTEETKEDAEATSEEPTPPPRRRSNRSKELAEQM